MEVTNGLNKTLLRFVFRLFAKNSKVQSWLQLAIQQNSKVQTLEIFTEIKSSWNQV